MSVEGKKPVRTCIGCGASRPKRELIRIVRTPDGEILLDRTGRANGRGAYLCDQESCLEGCMKKHALERTFSMAISPEVRQKLTEAFHEQ